jgi:hypothetical protein
MKILILAALCAASVPAAAQQQCATAADAAASQWTCVTGAANGAKDGKRVVRDSAEWRAFWRTMTKQDEAPAVDFKREAVAISIQADASGKASFEAVKVASGTGDKTAVRAAAAFVGASKRQASADERVGRMLDTVKFARGADGTFSPVASLGGFDGREAGLRDSVISPSAVPGTMGGLLKVQLQCTPGVDCPEQPQQRQRRQPDCTPGVDCPTQNPPRRHPNCTPGVDCPDDDGNGNGNGGGRTPLPPNYRPRPEGSPSSFPPIGDPDRYNDSVASGWYLYRNSWGQALETEGDWSDFGAARARVERGGSEVGVQGSAYTAQLESKADRPIYRVYWRYAGYDCDPNDSGRCLDWRVQYARFVDRWDHRSANAVVDVRFNDNGQKLLPWEKETLYVSFDGYRVGYDASNGAFRYSVNGPIINQQTGRASVEFVAGRRVGRQPEPEKVIARLENSNGTLQIGIRDRRAAFYEGEPLEIVYQVKKDCGHFYCSDKVVSERGQRDPLRVVVQKDELQAAIPVNTAGSGKYYLVWSFRRAQSAISTDGWINQGKGPKVQY